MIGIVLYANDRDQGQLMGQSAEPSAAPRRAVQSDRTSAGHAPRAPREGARPAEPRGRRAPAGRALAAERLLALTAGWERRRGPRYLALADAIADAAHQEELSDGTLLPPERVLARLASLSRGTVVAAYGELAERGLLERRRGSGTRLTTGVAPSGARALRSAQLAHAVGGTADGIIDLSFGGPGCDDVVADVGARLQDALQAGGPLHGYAPLGLPALRAAIADVLTRRGTPTDPAQIVVTTGAQGALQLLTAALVRRGDRVVVEAPTYPGAMELFSRAGAHVVPVRRDHAGPRPDDLARALAGPGAALVFLVPTCHNPTGSIMPDARRREVLRLCAEHDVLVVEDTTMSEVSFEAPVPPSLTELARGPVVTIGSFSKVLWGGLRTGWLRAERGLALRLGRLKAAQDLGSGMLDQAAVLAALPRYEEIVAARRRQAAERYAVLAGALAEALPDWRHVPPRGGWSLWAELPRPVADDLAVVATRRGVAIATGSGSAPDDLFPAHVRLCFPAEPAVLREGVRRLAAAWAELEAAHAGAPGPAVAAHA
jgi:DNA-binding transcriptional MocR family regulator